LPLERLDPAGQVTDNAVTLLDLTFELTGRILGHDGRCDYCSRACKGKRGSAGRK
jgi:hypothetical protein